MNHVLRSLPSFSRATPVHAALARFATAAAGDAKKQIEELVKKHKVFLFMKGTPEQPMCGFSNAATQVLRMHGVAYNSCDVLENEDIRQGIKDYSNWPTIPQLYIDGEFVGGCDILIEMHRSGDLVETLKKAGIRSALLDKDGK